MSDDEALDIFEKLDDFVFDVGALKSFDPVLKLTCEQEQGRWIEYRAVLKKHPFAHRQLVDLEEEAGFQVYVCVMNRPGDDPPLGCLVLFAGWETDWFRSLYTNLGRPLFRQ